MSVTQETSTPGKFGFSLEALRWMLISIGGLLVALLLLAACVFTLEISVELDWLRGKIETAASEALGRRIVIEGPFTLTASMPPAATIEGVHVGNPQGWPDADLARLDLAHIELRILPLLRGDVAIREIIVEGLQANLETNAAGEPNWPLSAPGEGSEPQTGRRAGAATLKLIELAKLSLRDIVLTHHDAVTDETFELKLEEVTGSAADGQPMRLAVRGSVQAVPYELRITGGVLRALGERRAPWPLDLSATVGNVRLGITGVIAEPLRAKGFDLDFDLAGRNAATLETILGTSLPPLRSFAVKGRIEETDGRYRLADLNGQIAGTPFTGGLEVDTAGKKPRLLGEIDVRRLDAGPLFAAIHKQEAVEVGAEAQPEPPGRVGRGEGDTEAEESIDIDEPVLTLEALETFDARFRLTIHEVVNAPASLNEASLQVIISDGALSAPLSLSLADVPFMGELSLVTTEGQPAMGVTLYGVQSDIGELAALLSGAEDIEGRFESAQLDFEARGETIRSLVESAELRFAIKEAALSYGHDKGERPVEFTLDEAQLRFPAAQESQITAQGSLLGEAFALSLTGGTFIQSFVHERWHLQLAASGAGAELSIGGTVRPAAGDRGTELDFRFRGSRIGALGAWVGVAPEASQPYALKGRATYTGRGIAVQLDEARIGNSVFAGQAGIRQEEDTAITFARLNFDVLDLRGLASLVPERPAPERDRVGPETLKIDVPILPRGIELLDSDIEIALARVRLERTDITAVSVSANIREGYAKAAPLAATIAGARFHGAFGIDLRGAVPTIDLRVRSSQIDVGVLLSQLGLVEGLALTSGAVDLRLALKGATTREMLQHSRLRAAISDSAWALTAPGRAKSLSIDIPEAVISAEPRQPITLALDGRIDEIPLQMQVRTDPLETFAEPKQGLQMDVAVTLAKADLKLTGAAAVPVRGDDLHFTLEISGEHFSDFDELLNVDLPPFGPYRLYGEFGSRSSGYYVRSLELTVGASTLTGKLDLETAPLPPRLELSLLAPRIQLDDFDTGDWSATGESGKPRDQRQSADAAEVKVESPPHGRPLLSPEVMRSLDAKVEVGVDEVLSGQDHLGRGRLTATLENGRFSVDPLALEVPGGSVDLNFALTPSDNDVALEAGARIDKLDYGILARRIDPESQTGGLISVDLDLKTRGPRLRQVMQGATGHLDFGIWPKDLNAGVFELWAVNVITALLKKVDEDEASKVNCVIVRFQIDDGLMQDRVVFADTSRMRVEGSAQVDFKQRSLKVRAAPKAKRPEFFSLAVPVRLSGQFDDFRIRINPVELGGKLISFFTSPLHVPLRRIFKGSEPADGAVACAEAWSTAGPEPLKEEEAAAVSEGYPLSEP